MKRRRARGTGRVFARGGVYYVRWRVNGIEKTMSTGIRVDEGKVGGVTAAARAEAVLMEVTDAVRIHRRHDALEFVRMQLAASDPSTALAERILDATAQTAPQTPPGRSVVTGSATGRQDAAEAPVAVLGGLCDLFRSSPRRRDCSDEMLTYYLAKLGQFVEWAGADVAIADVDDRMADEYAMVLSDRWANSTYNKHLNALDMAWRAVRTSVGVTHNPWADMPRKALKTHVRRSLTDEEVDMVIDAAEGDLKKLLVIGGYTALRLGDATHLRWEAFHAATNSVDTRSTKTGAMVSIPIHRRLMEVLGPIRKRGLVVPQMAAMYDADASSVCDLVKQHFERLGIKTQVVVEEGKRARPDCSFHSMRHTFATRAIEAGVPITHVKAAMGHSTVMMTEHYTHVSDQAVLDAFARVK